jgi:hypothetical protein
VIFIKTKRKKWLAWIALLCEEASLVDGIVILMLQQLVLVVSFMVIKYSPT